MRLVGPVPLSVSPMIQRTVSPAATGPEPTSCSPSCKATSVKCQGDPSGGGSPACRAARRAGLHKRITGRKDLGCEEARKTGDTARSAPAFAGASPWCARGAEPHSSSIRKRSVGRSDSEDHSRVARPVKRQPQERQHSAAEGGTRNRLPPASDLRATSRRVGINFAFVISSQCCACRHTACAYSLSQFFTEDDMAKKAKKAKKTAKAAARRWQRRLQRKRSSRIRD